MESFKFYSSLYDREQSRRRHLDFICIAILAFFIALTVLSSLNFDSRFVQLLTITPTVIGSICLYGAWCGFKNSVVYPHFGSATELRKYESGTLPKFNEENGVNITFESMTIRELSELRDKYMLINEIRGKFVAKAKICLFISVWLTLAQSAI